MLGKLLKYEFKSTARLFLPLYLALLLAAVINCVFSFLERHVSVFSMLDLPLVISSLLFVILLAAVIILTVVIIIRQFYKNLMTREGYLMFTLPVKPYQIILSKLITAFVWMAATLLIVTASLLILFGTADFFLRLPEYYSYFSMQLWRYTGLNLTFLLLLLLGVIIIGAVYFILMIYASISLGQFLISNHKAIGAFCAYLILYLGVEIVLFFTALPLGLFAEELESWIYAYPGVIYLLIAGYAFLYLIFSAVFFFISNYMLSRKLNLN